MMFVTLIICTYKRHKVIVDLLNSISIQTLYPDEILIIDGSPDDLTKEILQNQDYKNLFYYQVKEKHRGLTKQRNYGIERVNADCELICFLDDDTVLTVNYFQELLKTYTAYPEALGVGGYVIEEVKFEFVGIDYNPRSDEYFFDGYKRKDGSRFVLRKKLGLDSDCPPGYSSLYSHGRSVGFLPPSNKIYQVEMLMGGVSSFRKKVFENFQFSNYFEGYGLYEDADFSLRVAKIGNLYLNTAAKLHHYHDASGRPNQYQYGKMVVRNGCYVWRIKNPKPKFIDRFKWNAITLLLILIRFLNIFTTSAPKNALTETAGRMIGWFSLFFSKPK